MTTATISTPANKYLDEVRRGLSDLPEEDVQEVLQDLAVHIAELGDTDPETELGSPATFVSEFRTSAGLDGDSPQRRPGRLRIWLRRRLDGVRKAKERTAGALEPFTRPITERRGEIETAWKWSRAILALAAYSWITIDLYGGQQWLSAGGLVGVAFVYSLATAVSVWSAESRGKWWHRFDLGLSLLAGTLILIAITSSRYVPFPEETYYETSEQTTPALLIGPNGPIQNLYAYDLDGNQVQVLLYDEYGNPIRTLPEYAYGEASTYAAMGEPFIWEGYELRFVTDAYGRPIVNLYPLDRYEWTETGARSAPQPPPVVGIPETAAVAGDDTSTDDTSTTAADPPEGTIERR